MLAIDTMPVLPSAFTHATFCQLCWRLCDALCSTPGEILKVTKPVSRRSMALIFDAQVQRGRRSSASMALTLALRLRICVELDCRSWRPTWQCKRRWARLCWPWGRSRRSGPPLRRSPRWRCPSPEPPICYNAIIQSFDHYPVSPGFPAFPETGKPGSWETPSNY